MMHLLTTGKAITTIDLKLSLNSMNISASPWTICRMLKMQGMMAHIARRKPYLSPRKKLKCLHYAQKHEHWTISDWKHVIFSDETKINRFGSDRRHYI